MKGNTGAFSLVEILIVVVILGILAMIAVPKFSDASDDARESQLLTNVQTVRRVIGLYRAQHDGRGPHLNSAGLNDPVRVADRLTKRTMPSGEINPAGPCGPYLQQIPTNPYITTAMADRIWPAAGLYPPRNDTTGWYYCTATGIFWPNSSEGGDSLFP